MKKNRHLFFMGVAVITFILVLCTAESFPFIGNVIAARRITSYARTIYGISDVSFYAAFNPVSAAYYTTVQEGSGQNLEISCDYSGNIFDPIRYEEIMQHLDVEKAFAEQNENDERQFGYLSCHWTLDSPDIPVIILCVGIRESKVPFPKTDEDMLRIMGERLKIYYDLIPKENVKEFSQAYVSYQHYTEDQKDAETNDEKIYSIVIDLNGKGDLTDDAIMASRLTVRRK